MPRIAVKRAKTDDAPATTEPTTVATDVKEVEAVPVESVTSDKPVQKVVVVSKYNALKKIAKVSLSLSTSVQPKAYNDLLQVAKCDRPKNEKELLGIQVLLQQLHPEHTQYSMDSLLKMKTNAIRKIIKQTLLDDDGAKDDAA